MDIVICHRMDFACLQGLIPERVLMAADERTCSHIRDELGIHPGASRISAPLSTAPLSAMCPNDACMRPISIALALSACTLVDWMIPRIASLSSDRFLHFITGDDTYPAFEMVCAGSCSFFRAIR